jgi:hypothetical protein
LPEAATRPTLKLDKSPSELLDAAAKEYQNVLVDTKAPQLSRTTARFSLAAVAENRAKWDEAKSQYQSIVDDASTAVSFKAEARQRLAMLDLLKLDQFVTETTAVEGPIFAPLPKPATTQSSTAPAATGPAATGPATRSATAPAAAPVSPAPATSGPPAPAPPNVPVEKQ